MLLIKCTNLYKMRLSILVFLQHANAQVKDSLYKMPGMENTLSTKCRVGVFVKECKGPKNKRKTRM